MTENIGKPKELRKSVKTLGLASIKENGVYSILWRKTKWFKFYLSNRKFKVHIKNIFSEPGNLLCGVPQGSILGPLLFLLYINDVPQAVDCELLLYADDICLIFQHKDITQIESALNKNFSVLFDWFVDNKLSIHFGEDKTKSILFGSKQNHEVKTTKHPI